MKKTTMILFTCLMTLTLAGCSLFSQPAPTPTFPPSQTPLALLPTFTQALPTAALPALSPTPGATATIALIQPITATINVDNFKLRAGPGFLFDTVALYKINGSVSVLGRAPGDNWFYVETSDHRAGWMKMEYLELQGDFKSLPFIAVSDAQTITGHVRNPAGVFGSGIGILISPQNGYSGTNGDNALTDSSGAFYLYLPKNLEGDYFIEVNGYNCTGNLITGKCELPYTMPLSQPVTLPFNSSVSIEFVLK